MVMTARKVVVNKRKASLADVEIGRRMRALRLRLGLSQIELGRLIGVKFHQIQKYERGTNRVPAGRLRQLSEVLKAPVTAFYANSTSGKEEAVSIDVGLAYLETIGSARLVRAFSRIQDRKVRRILVELVERLGGPRQTQRGRKHSL
jgi:transcriptional regulator with XRE-family HTH domain